MVNKNLAVILFFFLLISTFLSAKNSFAENDSLYFISLDRVFVPTESSIIEARTGVTKYTNNDLLELDIGATIDIIGFKKKNTTYSFGVDFFTYSNLRSEDNFKFPVDAIDYLFGVNFNMKKKISEKFDLSGRFRISHISSHFEDGHIYERSDTIFTPVVFSKEFFEISGMGTLRPGTNTELKGMLTLNYIFHSIPDNISPFSGELGLEIDYYFTRILGAYFSNDINLATVNGNTNLNENLETGLSFGNRNSRKFRVYFRYYDGQDYRGQYYGGYFNFTGFGMKFSF